MKVWERTMNEDLPIYEVEEISLEEAIEIIASDAR